MTETELRALLAEWAPFEAPDHVMGGCEACGRYPPRETGRKFVTRALVDHAPDCLWVRTRRALGDTLE